MLPIFRVFKALHSQLSLPLPLCPLVRCGRGPGGPFGCKEALVLAGGLPRAGRWVPGCCCLGLTQPSNIPSTTATPRTMQARCSTLSAASTNARCSGRRWKATCAARRRLGSRERDGGVSRVHTKLRRDSGCLPSCACLLEPHAMISCAAAADSALVCALSSLLTLPMSAC